MGLLDGVKDMMTNTVVDKVSDVLGIENSMMKSAVKMFLPTVIGGIINKGSNPSGAGRLLDIFNTGGYGDDNLNDIVGVLGNQDKRKGWLASGADLLGNIFGNSQSGILDMLLSKTGLDRGTSSTLLKFLAPLVINKLAGVVKSKNLDANGLSSYLNDQRSEVMGLVPGLSSLIGGGTATKANHSNDTSDEGGMGLLKWLLPIALIGVVGWYLMQDGCHKKVETTALTTTNTTDEIKKEPTKQVTTNVTTNNNDTKTQHPLLNTTDFSTYDINDNLDIITGSGAVVHSSGSYDVDNSSNILDRNGKIIIPTLALPEEFKTKISSMYDRIRLARMKMMFGNMIVKKEGSNTTYGLSDINFKKDGHRIESFSKAEVEGLAYALKENATGKIEVHVYTEDGKSDKVNSDLADKRANVVRDMLVTLGVNKDQISAVGIGDYEPTPSKTKNNKVDIVVK